MQLPQGVVALGNRLHQPSNCLRGNAYLHLQGRYLLRVRRVHLDQLRHSLVGFVIGALGQLGAKA